MFGLYYALTGLLSGVVCSLIANKKARSQKDWFTLGQILPGISILILLLLSNKGINNSEKCKEQNILAVNSLA
jgi:uncharacterized membrane protein